MEKTTPINTSNTVISKGYYADLECCMCQYKEAFTGSTIKEVAQSIADAGWTYLNSDECRVIGPYCGCDYSEEDV